MLDFFSFLFNRKFDCKEFKITKSRHETMIYKYFIFFCGHYSSWEQHWSLCETESRDHYGTVYIVFFFFFFLLNSCVLLYKLDFFFFFFRKSFFILLFWKDVWKEASCLWFIYVATSGVKVEKSGSVSSAELGNFQWVGQDGSVIILRWYMQNLTKNTELFNLSKWKCLRSHLHNNF